VGEVATRDPVVAYPDETLDQAVLRMASCGLRQLPVVGRGRERRLLGMLQRRDVLTAYSRVLSTPRDVLRAVERYATRVVEVELGAHAPAVGKALRELSLPPKGVIASVVRNGRAIIPRGDLVLEAGDRLLVVTTPEAQETVIEALTGPLSGR